MIAGYSLGKPSFANSLILRGALLMLLALALFAAGTYQFIIRPTVGGLADAEMQRVSQQLDGRVSQLLQAVETTLRSSQGWGMDGSLDHGQLLRFNEYFFPIIANHPEISSVNFAHESGREILLLHNADGTWVNRVSNPDAWGQRTYWLFWNTTHQLERVEMRLLDYDTRTRPWHRGAMALASEKSIYWTEPYIFYTTRDPGITAAMRWTGSDGSRYVIGHDVRLLELASFTTGLTIGKAGRATLFQADGKLLAPPHDERFGTPDAIRAAVLKTPAELGLKDIEQGFASWQGDVSGRPGIDSYDLDGARWFSLFRPIAAGDQKFWLGVFAPEDEFLPASGDNLVYAVFIALLALLAGVAVSLRIARQFGRPLVALAKESARIGRMELDAPVAIDAPWWEIQQLANAQENMRLKLRDARQAQVDAHAALEGKVAERTRELSESQAALQEREVIFRAIFENAAIGISSLTPELRRLRVNRAFCEFVGYSEAQLLAGTGLDLIVPADRERVQTAYRDLAAGREHYYRTETGFVRQDGSVRWADIQLTAIRDADHPERVLSLLATILDTTDRHDMETELDRQFGIMRALLDTIPNPIFYKGADARFLGCNKAYEQAFGTSAHQVVGKRVLDLTYLPEADRIAYQAEDESVIRDAGHVVREVTITFVDGKPHDTLYSVTGFANRDGTPGGLVGLIVDISALKAAEREAQQARAAAETAAAAKADFLANMSHEIRTPMNAIVGLTHIILQTELTPRQRGYLDKVDAASKSLLGIINDILDFSKIEAGMMAIENVSFSLDEVMRRVADISVHKAVDKGLELLFDIAPEIPDQLVGDPLRLGQVLMNLVGNALKFTERGEVRVAVLAAGADESTLRLRFEVHDSGIGMSDEQRERLFAPFTQADTSTTRKYGGTGLGLSICKRLVELMGGRIDAISEPGRGSCFWFEVSVGRGEAAAPAASDPEMRGMRVLVVDDSSGAREITSQLLAALGFVVTSAASGAEGIEAARAARERGEPLGLVIADWQMPDLDGIGTLSRIRADAAGSGRIASILMTTVDEQGRLPEVLGDTAIDAFLAKPVTASSLFDAIAEALHPGARPALPRPQHHGAPPVLAGRRVLLVEDNDVNREMADEILRAAGLEVDTATNGAQAVERAAAMRYDAILMDCQMPVMDGFEATRAMRANAAIGPVPILAMTASVLLGDRELCLAAGMNDHVAKPIDVAELYGKLASWITQGKGSDAPVLPVVAAPQPTAEVPVLDRAVALQRLGGNEAMYNRLIAGFRSDQADVGARIGAALAEGQRDVARRLAHTLKGLAGSLGAAALRTAAEAVEKAIVDDHGPASVEAGLARLDVEMQRVLVAIDSLMAPMPARPAPTRRPLGDNGRALAAGLASLQALLAADDADAVRRLDTVRAGLAERLPADEFELIEKSIGRYEFDRAAELVRQAMVKLGMVLR